RELPAVLFAQRPQYLLGITGPSVLPRNNGVLEAARFGEEQNLLVRCGRRRETGREEQNAQCNADFFVHELGSYRSSSVGKENMPPFAYSRAASKNGAGTASSPRFCQQPVVFSGTSPPRLAHLSGTRHGLPAVRMNQKSGVDTYFG